MLLMKESPNLKENFMSLFEPNFEDIPGSKISTDCENALENDHFAVYFIHLRSKKKTLARKVHEICW